jgi:hypothetical protein
MKSASIHSLVRPMLALIFVFFISDAYAECQKRSCTSNDDCLAAQNEYMECRSRESPTSCEPASERSCRNVCDGEWGMTCPLSTVCDPINHVCEKAEP